MKKLNLWLLASLFVAAFTLTACGDDDDNGGDKKINPKKELIGTWKCVNPNDVDNCWTLTMGEDNSFSLSCVENKKKTSNLWNGTWEEQDGNIVVTINKYSNNKGDKDVEGEYTLNYKKVANGFLFYTDDILPESTSRVGVIFVREGETLNESQLKISDKELVGEWKGTFSFTINADGTFTYNKSEGRIVEIEPMPLNNGETLKQYVRITYNSSYISANIYCYVIKDDKLYINGWNHGQGEESVEAFMNQPPYWGMEVFTKVTE